MNNKCTRGGVRHSIKNRLRRGFTITELVIVIAVIAILAAVLIPTFSNVVKNANRSHDEQLVHNMNTSLNAYAIENGGKGPADYEELMKWFAEDGFCDSSNPYLLGTALKQDDVYLIWITHSNSVFLHYANDTQYNLIFTAQLGLGNGVLLTEIVSSSAPSSSNGYALCSKGNSTEEFVAGLYQAYYDVCQGDIGTFLTQYGGENGAYSPDKVLAAADGSAWADAIIKSYDNQTRGYTYSKNTANTLLSAAAGSEVTVEVSMPTAEPDTPDYDTQLSAAQQHVRSTLATLSVLSSDTAEGGTAKEMEYKTVKFGASAEALARLSVDFSDISIAPVGTTHRDVIEAGLDDETANEIPFGYSVDFCGLTITGLSMAPGESFVTAGAAWEDASDNGYPGGAYNYTYGLFGTIYAEEGREIKISNLNINDVSLDLNNGTMTDASGKTYQTISDSAGVVCGAAIGNVTFENIKIDGSTAEGRQGLISAYDAVGGIVGRCYGDAEGPGNVLNIGRNVVKIVDCEISDLKVQGIRKAGGITGIYSAGSTLQVNGLKMTNVSVVGDRAIAGDNEGDRHDSYAGLLVGNVNNPANTEAYAPSGGAEPIIAVFKDIQIANCSCYSRIKDGKGDTTYMVGGLAVDVQSNAVGGITINRYDRHLSGSGSTKTWTTVSAAGKGYENYLRLFGTLTTYELLIENLQVTHGDLTDTFAFSNTYRDGQFKSTNDFDGVNIVSGNWNQDSSQDKPYLLTPQA